MSDDYVSPFRNPDPYVPETLSEIYDLLGSLYLGAPTFLDDSGYFPGRNIESEFFVLVQSFNKVRTKVGDEQFKQLLDLATRAKALFEGDPADDNGKADEGRKLLLAGEDIIQSARKRRVGAKLSDDDGQVTGD